MEKGEVLGCGCQGTHHLFKMLVISGKFLPGSLARSCNVATDRLVYQDLHGLSATEH